jgi:hypothetical protein
MKPRRIALVAGAAGHERAPLGDHSWECWGLNAMWQHIDYTRCARWYELHHRSFLTWEQGGTRENAYFRWLRSLRELPVYVHDRKEWPEVLTARAFPWKEVRALVPAFQNYHACSIDWMLAHALLEGATEIRLCGVEQQHTAEPLSSRACVEFWAGVAIGRGITVSSADGSTFKLAHLTYSQTPYAFDPTWLPWEDRTSGSMLSRQAASLRAAVAGTHQVATRKERVG